MTSRNGQNHGAALRNSLANARICRTANESHPNPKIKSCIATYELAFRMLASVPGLMGVSDDPVHILQMDGTLAANCLLARWLGERGVRFIQLDHRDWHHPGQ